MTKRKPKSVSVEITQLDIRDGEPKDPCNCPVARAMARVLGRKVCVEKWTWKFPNEFLSHPLPARVCKFIKRFDQHAKVKPMTFRINARKYARRQIHPNP